MAPRFVFFPHARLQGKCFSQLLGPIWGVSSTGGNGGNRLHREMNAELVLKPGQIIYLMRFELDLMPRTINRFTRRFFDGRLNPADLSFLNIWRDS